MAKDINEGDIGILRGKITHLWLDETVPRVTINLYGHGPVTINADRVEIIERAPKPKRRVFRDKPD